MGESQEHIETEYYDEWTLVYTSSFQDGEYLFHAVQLFRDDRAYARITVVKSGLANMIIVSKLRERAQEWIADFQDREHSGDTDFAALTR